MRSDKYFEFLTTVTEGFFWDDMSCNMVAYSTFRRNVRASSGRKGKVKWGCRGIDVLSYPAEFVVLTVNKAKITNRTAHIGFI
jgi:hypothetical protein